MSGARRRLDAELVRRGLATSRAQAKELVERSQVLVSGAIADNAARQVGAGEPLRLMGPPARYVGRGGEKLHAALENFAIDVAGARAIDVGASTGGFTDCLLQHGAATVVALDVGHGQLHERLRADTRVDVRERCNVRHAVLADFEGRGFDVLTTDVSFISLKTVAPVIVDELANPEAWAIFLVKPQFEAGRQEVSRGKGVVSGAEVWKSAIEGVVSALSAARAATMHLMVSPVVGAEGNVEFLCSARCHQSEEAVAAAAAALDYQGVLSDAERLSGGEV